MTTPTPPHFDGELAWAISEWLDKYRPAGVELPREGIESLTLWLTKSGYAKSNPDDGPSLSDIRKLADKVQKSWADLLKGTP